MGHTPQTLQHTTMKHCARHKAGTKDETNQGSRQNQGQQRQPHRIKPGSERQNPHHPCSLPAKPTARPAFPQLIEL